MLVYVYKNFIFTAKMNETHHEITLFSQQINYIFFQLPKSAKIFDKFSSPSINIPSFSLS